MKKQKTILILGAGVYQVPLILESKYRGYRTIVASIPGNYPGFSMADQVYYVDTTDRENILKIAIDEKIDAITTTGTDVAIGSVGYVCSKLGLNGICEKSAKTLTDKALMKEAFIKGGVTTSQFSCIYNVEEAKTAAEMIGYPVVLKIVDKSGSRGIIKINKLEQIKNAYEVASNYTNSDYMIIEKFVDGQEIGIDAFIQNGKLKMIVPHGKYVYNSDRTGIPIGHYCPMRCTTIQYQNIVKEIEKIISSTGINDCAINVDAFFLPNEKISIIEAAGRCGATGIPEVISSYWGRNYYGCLLDCALGIDVDDFGQPLGKPTASVLLYSDQTGVLRSISYSYAGKHYHDESVNIKDQIKVELDVSPGEMVHKMQDGTDRIGMVVLSSNSYEDLQGSVDRFLNDLEILVD